MIGHGQIGHVRVSFIEELRGQLQGHGEKSFAVAVEARVVEAAIGIGADEEGCAAAVLDVRLQSRQFVIR